MNVLLLQVCISNKVKYGLKLYTVYGVASETEQEGGTLDAAACTVVGARAVGCRVRSTALVLVVLHLQPTALVLLSHAPSSIYSARGVFSFSALAVRFGSLTDRTTRHFSLAHTTHVFSSLPTGFGRGRVAAWRLHLHVDPTEPIRYRARRRPRSTEPTHSHRDAELLKLHRFELHGVHALPHGNMFKPRSQSIGRSEASTLMAGEASPFPSSSSSSLAQRAGRHPRHP